MNESSTSLTDAEPTTAEPMSLGARLFNVFAAPGELFEELRDQKTAHTNWLIPMLLCMVMGITFSLVVFSQPDIVASIANQQETAMAARVKAGKMTQEQADQAVERVRQFQSPTFFKMIGSLGAVFGTGIGLAVFSVLMWILMDKILKGDVSLNKSFELCGLSSMISFVGGLLTMLVVLLKGNIAAGPNAALLVPNFNQASYAHQFLGALNVMTIWYLVVLCIGASKLTRRPFGTAAFWIFGVWFVLRFGAAAGGAWWAQFQSKM